MSIPEDRLQALIDGQLAPGEAASLEATLSAEEAAYVARQRALRRRLAQDFDLAALPPPPSRLAALVEGRAEGGRVLRGRIPWRGAMRPPVFLAASGWAAAAALALAFLARAPGDGTLVGPGQGLLLAQGALAEALSKDLSGAAFRSGPGGEARAIASFTATDGRMCRLFEAQAKVNAHAGLACREPEGWSVVALVESPPLPDGQSGFRTASSGLPGLVLEAADGLRASDPLDAAAERTAITQGWRQADAPH